MQNNENLLLNHGIITWPGGRIPTQAVKFNTDLSYFSGPECSSYSLDKQADRSITMRQSAHRTNVITLLLQAGTALIALRAPKCPLIALHQTNVTHMQQAG